MKKKIFAAVFCALLLVSCGTGGSVDTTDSTTVSDIPDTTEAVTTEEPMVVTKPLEIHSISQLNTEEYELDTAVGQEKRSSLVKNVRESYTYSSGVKAYYPRIKKIDDSNYILVYHNTRLGGSVYCATSTDCIKWKAAVPVFKQSTVMVNGVQDNLKYMTPDACVLSDGRILCVTSYRAEHNYQKEIGENGVAISFSSDNGKTWTEPQKVYSGTNWEPFVLEAANGEIYIYFSSTAPSIYYHNFNDRSSGVGMIRSTDGGKTWTPNVTEAPYAAQYVMRQYVGVTSTGIKKYNDQMPAALQLHNGTIALAVETYDGKNYKFSISYNNDGYKEDLGLDKSGPAGRQTRIFSLAGPYLAQFDSGEVVLTYHWAGTMRYRLADAEAKNFYDAVVVHKEVGNWGSVEKVSSHSVVMAIGEEQNFTIKVARMYLNHDINAKRMTPTLTANTAEWNDNTDAIFVSGSSQAQTAVRIAHDDEYVYLLGERLDKFITEKDRLDVYFHNGNEGQYLFSMSNAGVTAERRTNNDSKSEEIALEELGVKAKITIDGVPDDLLTDDNGVVYELAIPKSLLNIKDGEVNFRIKMINTDNSFSKATTDDTNPGAGLINLDSWTKAFLK